MNFTYDLKEKFGIISEKDDGEKTLELNLISYDGKTDKYDLRRWDRSTDKMLKGITLEKSEIIKLKELLNSIKFD